MTSSPTIQPKFLPSRDELGVVAVGFSGGQCKPGVDAAPSALISSGLLTQLTNDLGYHLHHDNIVHSYAELMPESDPDYRGMKRPLAVSAVTKRISDQVYEHASKGRCVLTLGGDHSLAIGSIAGSARAIRERLHGRELAVIWVDAHADLNTPETSDSGNIHGMPVAFLTGLAKEDREDIFGWLREDQLISPKKLVYIGLRDVDKGEKKLLRDHGIKAFSMHDIDKHGIGRVMEMALGHIGTDTPIHLSFDVDALDPQWAPSTGTPVRGGLTLREGDYIAECVHETGSLIAMDLVEVNPSIEDAGAKETIRAGCSIMFARRIAVIDGSADKAPFVLARVRNAFAMQNTLALFARAVDQQDLDLLDFVFTKDMSADTALKSETTMRLWGILRFKAWYKEVLKGVNSFHVLSNHLIEIHDARTAHTSTAFTITFFGTREEDWDKSATSFGRHEDDWIKDDDGTWLIRNRTTVHSGRFLGNVSILFTYY
ncbi:MAG: Arginase, catabolizes arginine to ornithine and urea [Caeruleum heppii]|nr:MAG: Arginase, catabolizes arginine to ornithine and urea [Caeruleum heppii]